LKLTNPEKALPLPESSSEENDDDDVFLPNPVLKEKVLSPLKQAKRETWFERVNSKNYANKEIVEGVTFKIDKSVVADFV
jgi:hypothetical protein